MMRTDLFADTPKTVGRAALLWAVLSAVALLLLLLLIGGAAVFDSSRMMDVALARPNVALVQAGVKLLQAVASLLLIGGVYRMFSPASPRVARVAQIVGVGAAVLLLLHVLLSALLIAVMGRLTDDAGDFFFYGYQAINVLYLASLVGYGVFFLLVNWIGLVNGEWPSAMAGLGLVLGGISIGAAAVPPLGLLTMLLGIAWLGWLAALLLHVPATDAEGRPITNEGWSLDDEW